MGRQVQRRAQRISGQDLSAFFQTWLYTTDQADHLVSRARGLAVVPEEVGSSGPPWRLEVFDATSPKEDTG
jgi:hypothetical protein